MLINIKYLIDAPWRITLWVLENFVMRLDEFLHSPWCVLLFFAQSPLGFLLKRRKGLNALLSLKPRGLFISFARTKETKQRKFAVCTFWATPALLYAKQKELASLKQLFVFYAPKSTSASRPKSEAGPLCFLVQHRIARWGVMFSFFASLYSLPYFYHILH